MSELTLGMAFKVDGKDAVSTIKVGREELKNFREEHSKLADAQKKAAAEEENLTKKTEAYVATLAKKVATLGYGRTSMLQYEAAQLKLTEAEQKAVVSMQQSIDMHERKEASMEKVIGTIKLMTIAAGVAGVAMLAMIKKESIEQAIQAAQSQVRLESSLKATGYAAGLTEKQLADMNAEFGKDFRFKDDDLRNGIASMLKFKDVQGDMFQTGLRDAADYAEFMGTDFKSAVEVVGRAYQDADHAQRLFIATGGRADPATAARLKSLIDEGNAAEAQIIIHQKLQGAIGGTAAAMNTGLMKAQSTSGKAWDGLLQSIGETNVVGGRFERTAQSMTTFFNGLNGAVNGTDGTMLHWAADLAEYIPIVQQFSWSLHEAAMAMDEAGKPKPLTVGQLIDKFDSQDKARAGKEAQDAARAAEVAAEKARIAAELAAKAAESQARAYAALVKETEDYAAALERELEQLDMNTEQKKEYDIVTQAMKLHSREAQIEYMAEMSARAHALQLGEDEIKQRKEAEALTKKATDAQKAEIDALEKEIEAQKKHNDELINGKGAYDEYRAAQMEATLTAYEANGATDTETAALRRKIAALHELANQKAIGESITDASKAEDEFFKNMKADSEMWAQGFEQVITDAMSGGGFNGAKLIQGYFNSMELKPAMKGLSQDFGNLAAGGQVSPQFGMNLATVGGNIVGGQGARALGAGERGQQVGAMTGAIGAQVGLMVAGPIGAVVGAVLGSVIGKFTDPDGLAQRTASFGNPGAQDPTAQRVTSAFGTSAVFNTHWFSDDMKAGIKTFFDTLKVIDDTLATKMTAAQRQAATLAVDKSSEFNFGVEHSDVNASSAFPQIFRARYAAVLDTMGEGYGRFLKASEGTVQEMATIVDSVLGLTNAGEDLDNVIKSLETSAIPNLTGQIAALDNAVSQAQASFDAAASQSDPVAAYAAEQQLQAAIVNRYQTERQWVESIADSLSQLKQQAFQFQLGLAQKINSVGGNIDIASLAAGRGTDVRNSLNGISDPARRLGAINNYVSAVDAEYSARKAKLLNDIQHQQDQAQAAAQMQQAIAQARIAAMQTELQLAGQWNSVLGQTRQLIEQMRYSAASPDSTFGRYGAARNDSNDLFSQFQGASGQNRIDLATRLLPMLQQRQQLLSQNAQRPSSEYLAGYNEINAMLAEVEQYSQTQADKAAELQSQMVELQTQANSINVQAADTNNALLDELNAQYREQLTFASDEGSAAYAQQEQQHAELLNQITGGMEVDLFVAGLQQRATDALEVIKESITAFLTGAGTVATGGSTGAGGSAGAGGGVVETGGGAAGTPVNIYIGQEKLDTVVFKSVQNQPAKIRRELVRS